MDILRRMAIASLPLVPAPLLRKVASRYVAGEELADAIEILSGLRSRGFPGILDILGEGVEVREDARSVVAEYRRASEAVREAELDAYVSVKPTHVGLSIDESLALDNYLELAEHCRSLDLFLRVEMEDHPTTDATLRIFAKLRAEHDNVGIVLQSRLFRTLQDVLELPTGPIDVRMVKGIYLEPAEIAHTRAQPIRDAFVDSCRTLFERGARVCLATHDEEVAERCLAIVDELGVPPERYELQVLLGVREPLWERWREQGHAVRIYVPFGPNWMPYSLRRLRKNPQIFSHVVRDVLLPGR